MLFRQWIDRLFPAMLMSLMVSAPAHAQLLRTPLLSPDSDVTGYGADLSWGDDGSLTITLQPDVKQASVRIPVAEHDWRIDDTLELVLDASDAQGVFQLEVFEQSPPENTFLKPEVSRLPVGSQTYRYALPAGSPHSDVASILLTFYNGADNTHLPDSTIRNSVRIRQLDLLVAGDRLEKLAEQRAELFSAMPSQRGDGRVGAGWQAHRQKLLSEYNQLLTQVRRQRDPVETRAILAKIHQFQLDVPWQLESALLQDLSADQPLVHGWVPGSDKVFRQKRLPGAIGGPGELQLARRESEGIQLALYSLADQQAVRVTIDGLADSQGHRIESDQIQVMPVGYVNTLKPSYFTTHIGWTPDPLLTHLEAVDLQANHWQPFWIDVRTREDQPAGRYGGTVRVHVGDTLMLEVPLQVEVWNFTLPQSMSFPVAISSDTDRQATAFARFYLSDAALLTQYEAYMQSESPDLEAQLPAVQNLVRIRNQTQQMLSEHHIHQSNIYRLAPTPTTAWQRRELIDRGGRLFNMLYVFLSDPASTLAWLDEQVPKLKADGTYDKAYIYGYDEIRTQEQFSDMKRVFGAIKERYPEITLMATALDYTYGERTGTRDVLDVWIVPTPNYMLSREAAARARQEGAKVWWYTCNWPFPPSANFLLENTGSAHRLLMGLMPWTFEVDGYLYYHTSIWETLRYHGNRLVSWQPLGHGRVITYGPTGNGEDLAQVDVDEPSPQSGLWQEGLPLNQVQPRALIFSAQSRVLRRPADIRPGDYAMTCWVHYDDGSKEHVVFEDFDPEASDWQTIAGRWMPPKPIASISVYLRFDNAAGHVQFRQASLCEEGLETKGVNTLWHLPITDGPLTNQDGKAFLDHNGDGVLFYPAEDRTLPSLRLKAVRDGLEDYEYLTMLKQTLQQQRMLPQTPVRKAWIQRAEAALVIEPALVTSLTQYTLVSQPILEKRAQIASLLHQLPG